MRRCWCEARPVDDAPSGPVSAEATLGLLAELRLRGLAERVEGGWRVVRPR